MTEPHIEHGICAALQYIVSFVLRAARYLDVQLLYEMGVYRKKRNKFRMHTFIQRKGRYYRLYWLGHCHQSEDELASLEEDEGAVSASLEEEEAKDGQDRATSLPHFEGRRSRKGSGGNILEFEHALHLLEENINDLCIQCGVKSHKLHSFQFIANLIELVGHLELRRKEGIRDGDGAGKGGKGLKEGKRMERVQIVEDYGTNAPPHHTLMEAANRSISNSSSPSLDEAFANEASDLMISTVVDSETDEWDFVEFT